MHPRPVTDIEVSVDEAAFYLHCQRRLFQKGAETGVESHDEIFTILAMAPKLAKAVHALLGDSIQAYEQSLGSIG